MVMEIPKEFDIDSLPNISSELELNADGVDLRAMMDRLSALIECLEADRINALLNFPLYGLLLHDLSELECLSKDAAMFAGFLEEYSHTLDKLDLWIAEAAFDNESGAPSITNLPGLINAIRTTKGFDTKHASALDNLSDLLPDINANLETVARRILGIS